MFGSGKVSMKQILEPAITLGEQGFPVRNHSRLVLHTQATQAIQTAAILVYNVCFAVSVFSGTQVVRPVVAPLCATAVESTRRHTDAGPGHRRSPVGLRRCALRLQY